MIYLQGLEEEDFSSGLSMTKNLMKEAALERLLKELGRNERGIPSKKKI